MTMRYYLCPVVGSGKKDDPFRSKAAHYSRPHVSVMPSAVDGSPAHAWCLTLVDTEDHAPLIADLALTALPALKHAEAWETAPLTERTQVTAKAALLDSGIRIPANGTFAEVLTEIGSRLDPTFDLDQTRTGITWPPQPTTLIAPIARI